jgi:hypothetical protein
MSNTEYVGVCEGGPHDGQQKTYGAARMPVLASGADTEGQLLGYYVYQDGGWQWRTETQPGDDDRVR